MENQGQVNYLFLGKIIYLSLVLKNMIKAHGRSKKWEHPV
jgi:hypothetical protein